MILSTINENWGIFQVLFSVLDGDMKHGLDCLEMPLFSLFQILCITIMEITAA